MTALKPTIFHHTAGNGEVMTFKANTSVSAEGRFSIHLPDELAGTANTLWCKNYQNDAHRAPVLIERSRDRRYVTGMVLADCIRFINDAMQDHLACEVTRETVILYGTDIKVSYMKDASGNFFPNGYEAGVAAYERGDAKWHGTLDGGSHQAKQYSIGLVARAFTKITYRRSSGQKVVFEEVRTGAGRADSYLGRLNGFVGLARLEPSTLKELPYTEEAARFFYETMLGLCRLADRMEAFFGDVRAVALAIEQQTMLLPPPHPTSDRLPEGHP